MGYTWINGLSMAFCGVLLASSWMSGIVKVSTSPILAIPSTYFSRSISSALTGSPFAKYECTHPNYQVRIISYDPFVAHLENFITDVESKHLRALADPLLFKSRVRTIDAHIIEHKGRDSKTAHMPKDDVVVNCMAERASAFQGYVNLKGVDLQATYYEEGGFYNPHLDAGLTTPNGSVVPPGRGIKFRVSTIFGILDAECENCGTNFPNLHVNTTRFDPEWCKFIECGPEVRTLTTKAVKGSAVFWRNRFNDGGVDSRLIHAGMPLTNGTKYGLNIWTSTKGPPAIWDEEVSEA